MDNVTWIPVFAYLGAIGLFIIGIAAMVFYTNVIRVILGLLLLESGVNLFLITVGYRPYAEAPILVGSSMSQLNTIGMVDPVPQALVLTSIVIGVGVQALALALVIKVHQSFGTLDLSQLTTKIATLTKNPPEIVTQTSVSSTTYEADTAPPTEKEQHV